MKKKLLLLLVLGYIRGSLSEGPPLSPFGQNPFDPTPSAAITPAAAPAAPENPFMPLQPSVAEGSTPSSLPTMHPSTELPSTQNVDALFHSPSEHSSHADSAVGHLPHADIIDAVDTGEAAVIDSEVDTFEQEGSGNWLLKRVWWEKTEPVYEQIKQVFNDIMNARMDFISQRNRLDRELDISYGQIGLEEGELQDIVDYCLDLSRQEKKEQGFLNKKEEDLYNVLQNKQRDLEQIKLDVKALRAVDQKIDEALDTLFKQIDVANQYEQKAWDNFKDIARELNDKIARKSYYETEGLLKDIQNIHSYITTQFSTYFNQILQSARTHSQGISTQVHSLKQSGVDLKKQAEALEHAQEAERAKKEIEEHEKEAIAAEKKKEIKKEAAQGWVSYLMQSAKNVIVFTYARILDIASSTVSTVKGWFVKEEKVIKAREKALKGKIKTEEALVEKKLEAFPQEVQQDIEQEKKAVEQEEIALLQPAAEEVVTYVEDEILHNPEAVTRSVLNDQRHVSAAHPTDGHATPFEVHHPSDQEVAPSFEHPLMPEPEATHVPSVMPQEHSATESHKIVHPVSVMPQEPVHHMGTEPHEQVQQAVKSQEFHNPVASFGPPPTEAESHSLLHASPVEEALPSNFGFDASHEALHSEE